jgi:phage FluMu gp28-like protein
MKPEILEAYQKIEDVKIKLRHGANYNACQEEARPALEVLNSEGTLIAKRCGTKFKKLSFTSLMR